ncbi:unnamed protein product [Schistosoma turkestanicum]|nr:unnamed protein product [Schistosoma turkestanicum]
MITHHNVTHKFKSSSNYLTCNIYFLIFLNLTFVFHLITCSTGHEIRLQHNNVEEGDGEELKFTILEELPKGTIIASNAKLGNLFTNFNNNNHDNHNNQNFTKLPRILNVKDPGVRCFDFKWIPFDKHGDLNELQLIVSDRIDREMICPLKTHELSSTSSSTSSTGSSNNNNLALHPVNNQLLLDYELAHSSNNVQNPHHDCIVTLRIAIFTNNLQKIYQIHVIIEDINDNAPQWTINKLTLNFHDDDPPGTKQSIPLAKDMDIGMNAKINYQLLNSDTHLNNNNNNNNMHSYLLNEPNHLKLRATDMFELITEKVNLNHFNDERLFLTARHTLDRESTPQGWDLILLASNNNNNNNDDLPSSMSSRLLIHINLIDVNDNSPKFSQSLYKPQLPNQKVGSIPEDYPVGKTILRVHASDADEGRNAEITYSFAPDLTNPLIRHFFEITKDGELRVLQPLNVDMKTQQQQQSANSPNLPTSLMSFDVIAVDGAIMPYAKTGHATIQLEIENIDDEPPEIHIHPIQSLQDTTYNTYLNHHHHQQHQSHETEIAVLENQSPGELIALIEVKDPDLLTSQMSSQCLLTGPNANNFRLSSFQDSIMNNEYRLYTTVKLDREKQAQLLLTIECKDLADHMTISNIMIHVLDVNDQTPQCTVSHYHFAIFEDDNEDDDGGGGADYYENTMTTTNNRSWFTPDGLAYILAKDNDIGLNSKLTYYLPTESIDTTDNSGKFSINSETGQLYAWGPFDREQKSSYTFNIMVKDNGPIVQLSTNCLITVNILDINDNPPIFHPKLSITGGYLFSIAENLLPGTRVGQIEAVDLDNLPPGSIELTEIFNDFDKFSFNLTNGRDEFKGIKQNFDKKLTYSLKNEHNSQAFRIDPKTGVIMTRTLLDRERQATYTFYAYVHDGPENGKTLQHVTNSTQNKTKLRQTLNNEHRSHTASILITITIQDENDNDPVFIRPNSTNHMILLNPTAIPGQSLSQLLAIDPDEGLNGQISYAIKGETAGVLFNIDSRTGLLYLESQIPRQYLTNNQQQQQRNPNMNNNHGNDLIYPTFLLALDACDHGEPRRCTHFPNLQIQIRSSSNMIDEIKSNEYGRMDLSISQQSDDTYISKSNADSISSSSLSASAASSSLLSANFFSNDYSAPMSYFFGKYSLGELLIIGLSSFFSILVLIILFTVCFVRRRTQQMLQNNEPINPELLKLNHANTGFNVELHEKSKPLKSRAKLCNWYTSDHHHHQNTTVKKSTILNLLTGRLHKNNRPVNTDQANVNKISTTTTPTPTPTSQSISCGISINRSQPLPVPSTSASASQQPIMNQSRLNYPVDLMNHSRIYQPNTHSSRQYSPYSPIFINTTNNIPTVPNDYQSLDCWDNNNSQPTIHYPNKFKQDNLTNTPPFYTKPFKQSIGSTGSTGSGAKNSNSDFANHITTTISPSLPMLLHNNNNNNKQSHLLIANHEKSIIDNQILMNTTASNHYIHHTTNNHHHLSNGISPTHLNKNDHFSSILLSQQQQQQKQNNNLKKIPENSQAYTTGLMKSTFV